MEPARRKHVPRGIHPTPGNGSTAGGGHGAAGNGAYPLPPRIPAVHPVAAAAPAPQTRRPDPVKEPPSMETAGPTLAAVPSDIRNYSAGQSLSSIVNAAPEEAPSSLLALTAALGLSQTQVGHK